MELINNFTNLTKNLSEKFRLSKSETSLYLLAFIYDALNLAEYREFMSVESHGIFLIEDEVLDSNTFRSIKDSGLVNVQSFSKYEIRAFTQYLIVEYLKSANISVPSLNFLSFIVDIATESALELHSSNDNEYTEWVIYLSNIKAGDIVIELLKKLKENHISEGCGIVGNEPNKILNFLTEINYFINDINENLLTTNGNSLTLLGDDYSIYGEVQIAVSLPPFSNIQQQDLKKLYKFIDSTEKIYFSELAYIELMLKRVSERGKVIAVVRNEFLSSRKSKVFREKYLKNDWIEKIIALPKEFVGYPMDVSVIVLNKTKIEKGFVVFDGSEDKFEKTKVSIEEVFSNDVDLRVARYAAKESKEVESILSKYPQYEIKQIKDLIDSSIAGFNYSPKNRIVENSSETLPYVRVKDLSNNDKDFTLDISKVERKISPEKVAHKRTIIDFSAVLISKIAPNLKPTLFNFTGQPIVIGSDVVALKVKEDVNVEYFLTQLYSQLVKIQVEMMSSGITINRISTQDFLNIKIILPPLEEQKRQFFEMRGVIEEKAIAQEQLSIAIKEIETTEYDVIAAITHNLNQKLGQIVDDYGTLMLFLQTKEKTQMPIRFDEMLRPMRNGESFDNIPTFSKVANRLQNNLLDTAYTMKTTENILQKSVINTEEVDIIKFFKKSIKADFENPHFTLKIESKLKSLIVLADINALKDAFRNLIENAKKHGFTHNDQNYRIVFEISKFTDNSGDNFARIVYKNNGNPFPKSYRFEDYIRLGTRMGKNKGTGIGGFFVKKVIDLHKGSFKEITLHENNQETFQVQMEILLPLAD
ncbi:MAG TPA: N-6 DNA methylase [Pyrinomonadaceae bacterium]|nr:N-6 DNA methylase [Pyrinomonadaceae bacterium]